MRAPFNIKLRLVGRRWRSDLNTVRGGRHESEWSEIDSGKHCDVVRDYAQYDTNNPADCYGVITVFIV